MINEKIYNIIIYCQRMTQKSDILLHPRECVLFRLSGELLCSLIIGVTV